MNTEVQELSNGLRVWAKELLQDRWGSCQMVTRGRIHEAHNLPGFVALVDGKPKGLITYRVQDGHCEIVSLDSTIENKGVGTALLEAVLDAARSSGCCRIWVVTTNDNTPALRFYQRRGLQIVALHKNAIEVSRTLKPEIPQLGVDGIAILHEIELEYSL